MPAVQIAFESPDQPEVIALIARLDAYQDTLYPPESRHSLDLRTLVQPHVIFAVARSADGRAVACGAVVLGDGDGDGDGELKRMYVTPECRGLGVARRLLEQLESAAIARGCRQLRLETGPYQPEALGLYARCGYARCGRFGTYADDPLSVFMHKALQAP